MESSTSTSMRSRLRMPLDPEFLDDCPYAPTGFLIDEILEIDAGSNSVRALMHTHADLPLTREQRVHATRHPRHVSGGLMVHMTGMLGFVHAYYTLGLRHRDGWIGYGGRIYDAKFRSLAKACEPLVLEARMTQLRRREKSIFVRYEFRFLQGEALVYTGDQSAMWMKMD